MSKPLYILAHDDADGVCSAALCKKKYPEAKVVFGGPKTLQDDVEKAPLDAELIIVDIGFNATTYAAVFERLRRRTARTTMIDHHPLPEGISVDKIPVSEVHIKHGLCAAELTYHVLFKSYDPKAALLAIYGAIGDYMDDTEFVQSEYKKWDKRTLYFEGSMLTEALICLEDHGVKEDIVEMLSKGIRPSQIPSVLHYALKGFEQEYRVYEYVENEAKVVGPLAIVWNIPHKNYSGKAASYAAAFLSKPVGICLCETDVEYEVSLRSRSPHVHLGKAVERATIRVGGQGGGHPQAAGAAVPKEKVEEFLKLLEAEVRKQLEGG